MRNGTVWFNKSGLSNYAVIESIKAAADPGEFRFACTHTRSDFAVREVSDIFEIEPAGLGGADYVSYCLDFARRHEVNVFFPDKGVEDIARARDQFEALGIRLMIPTSAEGMEALAHKGRQFALIGEGVVPIPDYRVVSDLAGFDAAYAALKLRHERVCFKPCESIFGVGFRAITEEGSELQRLFNGNNIDIGLEEARRKLGLQPKFRDLMVMEYLAGPEHSVDCLVHDGRLVRATSRIKVGDRVQLLEPNTAGIELALRLAEKLGLNGLFNAQFRESNGTTYLLEINPRMSGGMYVTFHSGISLPYWAIKLALGLAQPSDVPEPQTGIMVGQLHRSVLLSCR